MQGGKGGNGGSYGFESRGERGRNWGVLAANGGKKFFLQVVLGARLAVRKVGDFIYRKEKKLPFFTREKRGGTLWVPPRGVHFGAEGPKNGLKIGPK